MKYSPKAIAPDVKAILTLFPEARNKTFPRIEDPEDKSSACSVVVKLILLIRIGYTSGFYAEAYAVAPLRIAASVLVLVEAVCLSGTIAPATPALTRTGEIRYVCAPSDSRSSQSTDRTHISLAGDNTAVALDELESVSSFNSGSSSSSESESTERPGTIKLRRRLSKLS